VLRNGYRASVIYEGESFVTRESEILEGWINLYQHGILKATIPKSELKREFRRSWSGDMSTVSTDLK
jgi:hypothetical protein